MNVNQKGKRVEREIAAWLRDCGILSARRTQQYNGEGLSDVVADELPEWHIESKGTKSALLTKSLLISWTIQVKKDCPPSLKPVIFNKANGKAIVAITTPTVFNYYRNAHEAITEIFVGDSVNAYQLLEDMRIKHTVEELVGLVPPTNPINVFYYPINEDPWVFMLGVDWLRLIGHASSKSPASPLS